MESASNIAFKEWAVVCAALGSGRQTIILRKGGIDEGRDGFRVNHGEFWLLPTRFHQDPTQLVPDARPLWEQTQSNQPVPGQFLVDLFATVHSVFEVRDEATLERLNGLHILSLDTLHQRYHYRRPGLFVLTVRTYRVPKAYQVADSPYIAGCKSWVELPEQFSTAGAAPVLDDATFDQQVRQIEEQLHGAA